MSWTDIFPVLDEEMMDTYKVGVTEKKREEFAGLLGVKGEHRTLAAQHRTSKWENEEAAGTSNIERPTPNVEGRELEKEGDGKSPIPPRHIVSATLFWKHVNEEDPELPAPTREMLFDALKEEDALVSEIRTDRMNEVSHEIGRTEGMAVAGHGLWRVPEYYNSPMHEYVRYRSILSRGEYF